MSEIFSNSKQFAWKSLVWERSNGNIEYDGLRGGWMSIGYLLWWELSLAHWKFIRRDSMDPSKTWSFNSMLDCQKHINFMGWRLQLTPCVVRMLCMSSKGCRKGILNYWIIEWGVDASNLVNSDRLSTKSGDAGNNHLLSIEFRFRQLECSFSIFFWYDLLEGHYKDLEVSEKTSTWTRCPYLAATFLSIIISLSSYSPNFTSHRS